MQEVSYQRVYRKGMLMRGRLMEVQAREEVRCMLKRSACRGTESLTDYRPTFQVLMTLYTTVLFFSRASKV
jgi:hypothetical protein